mmetsp:Transcript_10551/g.16030  ORF Transcript_10551/g.16030 Transcript_10551/m.16030 type:complete len:208 (+) Transcript_10551:182-805(+)
MLPPEPPPPPPPPCSDIVIIFILVSDLLCSNLLTALLAGVLLGPHWRSLSCLRFSTPILEVALDIKPGLLPEMPPGNATTQQVMLSLESNSRHVSMTSSQTSPISVSPSSWMSFRTSLAQSLFVRRSQIPSHANTMYSSLAASLVCTKMSGTALTRRCFSLDENDSFFLYEKSPKARLTARSPSTRPFLTKPPDLSTLTASTSLAGL